MCKFLRLVDDSIVNLFVRKVKDVSECYHHFENRTPDSFCDCEFRSPRVTLKLLIFCHLQNNPMLYFEYFLRNN